MIRKGPIWRAFWGAHYPPKFIRLQVFPNIRAREMLPMLFVFAATKRHVRELKREREREGCFLLECFTYTMLFGEDTLTPFILYARSFEATWKSSCDPPFLVGSLLHLCMDLCSCTVQTPKACFRAVTSPLVGKRSPSLRLWAIVRLETWKIWHARSLRLASKSDPWGFQHAKGEQIAKGHCYKPLA